MKPVTARWDFRFLLRLSAFALAIALHPCHADSRDPTKSPEISRSLVAAITKQFPGFEPHITDEADGYAAAILVKPIPNESEHQMKVSVFQKADNGMSYQLLAVSKSWKEYLPHRVGWSIGLKNQSILLYLGGSTSCCSGFETELRFKTIGESFQLVGEETWSHGIENSGSDSEKHYENRISINYLTGKVIHYKLAGAGRDCRENETAVKGRITRLCFDGRPRSKELEMSFSTSVLTLSAFQPDRYWAYQKTVPQLCGYINEKMKYEPCKQR